MKRVLSVLLLLAGTSFGLSLPCGSRVADLAGVFSAPQLAMVNEAAQELANAGAEPRVVTLSSTNLDQDEAKLVRECEDWHGPNGIKSTLIVLMVAPREHKMGLYFGHAWDSALGQDWNRIKQEEMMPRFKSAQWAEGMIAGMNHMTKRIIAHDDEARFPKQTTVVEQPTDLSGLWHFLMWCLAVGSALGLLLWLAYWLAARGRKRDQWAHARTNAILARNHVTNLISKLRITDLKDKEKVDRFNSLYDQFSDLVRQARFDPNDEKLQIGEYQAIEKSYRDLASGLEELNWASSGKKDSTPPTPSTPVQSVPSDPPSNPPASTHKKKVRTEDDSMAPDPERTGAKGDKGGVVSNSNVFAPVIVGNDFGSRDREEEPRYREPEREPEPEPSFGSGGSSAWDSPSSGSDSSSSSDYGSGGSSDFGGGDSGGGSDSGSGGSSDF